MATPRANGKPYSPSPRESQGRISFPWKFAGAWVGLTGSSFVGERLP
ncbi:hypothetical protein [Nostoc sp. 106C]|nr:hypothetical protein [Nostoc sp. 106C]